MVIRASINAVLIRFERSNLQQYITYSKVMTFCFNILLRNLMYRPNIPFVKVHLSKPIIVSAYISSWFSDHRSQKCMETALKKYTNVLLVNPINNSIHTILICMNTTVNTNWYFRNAFFERRYSSIQIAEIKWKENKSQLHRNDIILLFQSKKLWLIAYLSSEVIDWILKHIHYIQTRLFRSTNK